MATLNGAKRTSVFIYPREGESNIPLCSGDAVLADAAAREKIIAWLPEEQQMEAGALLLQLAADVASEQSRPRPKDREVHIPVVEPWDVEVNGAELLDDLVRALESYVVLPPYAAEAIALWVVHTYAVDAADYTPYLHLSSPVRACGKTTLLEILENLASRAYRTDSISAAALYRKIHRDSPTMLLDELDARLRRRDGAEDLRGVLNSGFKRGGKHTICVGDDHIEQDFSTYSPKVLSGIGRIWDTVSSRSIPIRLMRASSDELRQLKRIRGHRIATELEDYRRRAARWAIDHVAQLRNRDPVTPVTLGARECDVWRPLLAIADHAGVKWPERARKAAQELHGAADDESDYGLLILADLREVFSRRGVTGSGVFTKTIIEELVQREDRPWPEYSTDGKSRKPITPTGLANLMRRFDVRPENVREMPGESGVLAKGYHRDKLTPLFTTFLTPANPPAQPSQPLQADAPVTNSPVTPVTARDAAVTAEQYQLDERIGMQEDR